jgi:hypothetical protein
MELPSLHDNAVNGFFLVEGEHGVGQVILDLDHIVEWLCPVSGEEAYAFMVAPAYLIFHDASDLQLSLNYHSRSAALQPFMIREVRATEISYPNGAKSFAWEIEVNWPDGSVKLHAPKAELVLRAPPVKCAGQSLEKEVRDELLASNNSLQARRP